jgi:hypothetical protein
MQQKSRAQQKSASEGVSMNATTQTQAAEAEKQQRKTLLQKQH